MQHMARHAHSARIPSFKFAVKVCCAVYSSCQIFRGVYRSFMLTRGCSSIEWGPFLLASIRFLPRFQYSQERKIYLVDVVYSFNEMINYEWNGDFIRRVSNPFRIILVNFFSKQTYRYMSIFSCPVSSTRDAFQNSPCKMNHLEIVHTLYLDLNSTKEHSRY